MATWWWPDAPPASAGAEDDEFGDSSLAGAWTETDHGAIQTVTEDAAGLALTNSSTGDVLAGVRKAIPAGDFTYWCKVSVSAIASGTTIAGLGLWEDAADAAGDLVTLSLWTATTLTRASVDRWTAYNVFSTTLASGEIGVTVWPTHLYLRVRRTGTTYAFDFSTDGILYERAFSTAALGTTPLHIGPVFSNNGSGGDAQARFAFWRYMASDVGITALMAGDRLTSIRPASIGGSIATASARIEEALPLGDGDVGIFAPLATAQASVSLEYVGTQAGETIAGEVAQAIAAAQDAVITALGPSVSISAERAQAIAAALPADDLASNNPAVLGAIATALAAVIPPTAEVPIGGAVARAYANVIPPDVLTTLIEPPIGSGGGGSTGGGSGSAGAGGSPAGFNWGACAIDFAIDLYVLTAQPFAIAREGPQHEFRTSPRGYTLPSLREGREWRFTWGESLVDIATVSELRQRLGTALRHRFTWTEPDGTPMDIIGSITAIEFSWSQVSPGFYAPAVIHVQEHER